MEVLFWENNQWQLKGETFIGGYGEKIGHNVNISSDANTIVIGSPLSDTYGQNTGEIRIYHWVNDAWIPKGNTFTSIDPTWNSHFASSINADGDIVAFWSHEDTEEGGVQVHHWNNGLWEQVGTDILKLLDGDGPRNNFISLNDNGCKVAIGSPVASTTLGRVNIFELETTRELELCTGDTIYVNDTPYFEEGDYINTLTSAEGCDTTVFLNITLKEPKTTFLTFEACENNAVIYEGQQLEIGFTGQFNHPISESCDSIVFVEVIELENITTEVTEFICKDSFLLFENEPIEAGSTIEVHLTSSLGCDSIILKHVEEYDYSSNFLPEDIQICDKEVVVSSPFSNTIWNNGEIGETTKISESSTVSATYINDFGCRVRDTINVQLENTSFYIPNVIHPNSSAGNECFQVEFSTSSQIEMFELMVFDRWGSLIWSTRDITDCWGGTSSDRQLIPGVYVWSLEFKDSNCDKLTRKFGDLTLIK